jgi:Fe-S-cluster containining protein
MESEREENFFKVCSACKISCCRDAKPPITEKREKIILEFLTGKGVRIENPFIHGEYTFPRETENGYCIFYDEATRKCIIHPVKPETCVAGPITFDINKASRKVEWYLKMEKICPLAGVMYKDKDLLKKHFEVARKEILELIRELRPEALKAILKREEPDTFKIGEEDLEEEILGKLF